MNHTAILTITEGQFQVFQRFTSSKLVLQTVESCFAALKYYENGGEKRRTLKNRVGARINANASTAAWQEAHVKE